MLLEVYQFLLCPGMECGYIHTHCRVVDFFKKGMLEQLFLHVKL